MLLIPTLLCPKSWENMAGDETRRFCTYCKKHVHNLEALSVSERLALLASPAASICSRYQVAIRRPVKGHEESYARHLLKYGAGVALTGSVLLVLWEMRAEFVRDQWHAENRRFYRAAAADNRTHCGMPDDFYREDKVVLMGEITLLPKPITRHDPAASTPFPHIDINLDPLQVDRLLEQTMPKFPVPQPYPPQI